MTTEGAEPETGDPAPSDTDASSEPDTGTEPDLAAELAKWKAMAQKQERRAKANAQAAGELEALKRQTMTDTEKAVAEATAAATAEATQRYGSRLVAAEIRAAAAGRLDAGAIDTIVASLNVGGFLDESGEVDTDAVVAFVNGIAPAPETDPSPAPPAFPDLGQGARANRGAPALNGDPLLRDLKAHLGIR